MSTAIPMPQKTYDCTRLVCIIFREQSTSYSVSVLCLRQSQCLRRHMTYTFGMYYISGTIYLLRCLCVMSTAIPMPQKTYDCTRLVCIIFREQSTSYGVSVLCLRQYQCLRRRMTVHVWYVLYCWNNPPLTVSLCYVYSNTNASEDV